MSKQLQLGGCRRCSEEGNPRQYPIEELHAVGNLFLCDRHYHGASVKTKVDRKRVLGERCFKCGSEFIEEDHEFGEELLAVAVCKVDREFDWQIPSPLTELDDPTTGPLFEQSREWAFTVSRRMLRDKGLVKVISGSSLADKDTNIRISEQFVDVYGPLDEPTAEAAKSLAREFDRRSIHIGKFASGIRIDIY